MTDLSVLERIRDPEIRAGVRAAIEKNLIPACHERAYPGHFSICADGKSYGEYATWPRFISWQMVGAYLLLGMKQIALGYFDFVEKSQREDGAVPFIIARAEDHISPESRWTYARGMRWPEDIFTYTPKDKNYKPEQYIGLFRHWMPQNPLSMQGTITYPLTAYEIYQTTRDREWLFEKMPSLERAYRYILTQKSPEGLIGGAAFYIDAPSRSEWGGVTQCAGYLAFYQMSELCRELGDELKAEVWRHEADVLGWSFRRAFWKGDRFAEYIHPERGAITRHGHTDVDFAAIACGLADAGQKQRLWDALKTQDFWAGGMPTRLVTDPVDDDPEEKREFETARLWRAGNFTTYLNAALGSVWFSELNACLRMQEYDRIRKSVKLVCQMGLAHGGYWSERYQLDEDGKAVPAGCVNGYCEYPAVLTRFVLGNMELFE
ncbi:MAG TPA: hypothetical protein PK854_10225 [Oscillospiraceae bacterium]|nr:hypothetical protein [Oscillospiraceae bacterium]HPS35629.1 hypothetical protein [Oscillospiraceae bacterium]